jgi:voltage-gated potassium channel Kch
LAQSRGVLYLLARILGDLIAVRRGRVGRRIARRIVGRATGRMIGRLFR